VEIAMKTATCIFELLNDSQDVLFLYLEPEGSNFHLPPGKAVKVHLFGKELPIEMKHSVDESGIRSISFWPAYGDFELFFEGVSVWEQV
jgi:hypothetical protein